MTPITCPSVRLLLLGLCLALAGGCAIDKTLAPNYAPPVAASPPIPMRAGLVLDKQIRQARYVYTNQVRLELGPALAQAAEAMVRQAFREVVVIPADTIAEPEALTAPQGVDVLVVPQFKEAKEYAARINAIQSGLGTRVVLKWTIVKEGKVIYTNTFTGKCSNFWAKIDESFSLALKDQFDQAYQGIVTSPWWKAP